MSKFVKAGLSVRAVLILSLGATVMASGSLFAQDPDHFLQIGQANSPREGAAEIDLDWVSADAVENFTALISYDPAILTPRTTVQGTGERVDDCIAGLPATHTGLLTGCSLVEPGQINLVISDQSGVGTPLPTGSIGKITFDVADDAPFDLSEITGMVSQASSDFGATDLTARVGVERGGVTVVDLTAILNVTPATLSFGAQQIGTTSAPQPVTISNDGTDGVDLSVTAINITGDFGPEGGGSCEPVPFTLADGASCTQHVEFRPSAEAASTGSLTVVSNAGEVTNDTVSLSGEGVPSDARLAIDLDAHNFGSLDLNDDAATQTFTISSEGVNDAVTGITVPALSAPFSITDNTCGATLAPQATCQITVSFDPSEEGTFNATLAVNSDANNVSAALTGEGTATADISVNPPFGRVNLGSGSAGETLTTNRFAGEPTAVTNSGSAAATVSCALEDESTAGVFSTDPALTNVEVAAGATVAFSLSCALPATGDDGDSYTATLACSVDGEAAGTHQLECSVDEFEPLPVPTMTNWSIALFAMLMLLVGGISLRFFRT